MGKVPSWLGSFIKYDPTYLIIESLSQRGANRGKWVETDLRRYITREAAEVCIEIETSETTRAIVLSESEFRARERKVVFPEDLTLEERIAVDLSPRSVIERVERKPKTAKKRGRKPVLQDDT
jgi:hypothetical protein